MNSFPLPLFKVLGNKLCNLCCALVLISLQSHYDLSQLRIGLISHCREHGSWAVGTYDLISKCVDGKVKHILKNINIEFRRSSGLYFIMLL